MAALAAAQSYSICRRVKAHLNKPIIISVSARPHLNKPIIISVSARPRRLSSIVSCQLGAEVQSLLLRQGAGLCEEHHPLGGVEPPHLCHRQGRDQGLAYTGGQHDHAVSGAGADKHLQMADRQHDHAVGGAGANKHLQSRTTHEAHRAGIEGSTSASCVWADALKQLMATSSRQGCDR